MEKESLHLVNPKVLNSVWNNVYQALTLAFTLLFLLLLMKIKILLGYKFLWPRIFQLTGKIIPESLGIFNPIFYIDDIYLVFLSFIIFCYLFTKNNWRLNGLVYFLYLAICIFSIVSSFAFYKYETPLNLAILSQIDSLYIMRTSIDTELMENFRLATYLFVLLIFAISAPVLFYLLKSKIFKKVLDFNHVKIKVKWLILFITSFSIIFLIKSYYFGMDILTETPITTLSKSIMIDLKNSLTDNNRELPLFNDQIKTNFAHKSFNKPYNNAKVRKKYNVILIVLETTNHRFFLPDGPFIKYFPNFNRLNKKGLYFRNFFSPFPRSSKAFFAILTGHYPLTNYRSTIKIAPQIKVPSLFQILKHSGYSTFAGYSGDFNYDRMAKFLKNREVDRLVDIYDNNKKYKQISWCADDEMIYDQLMSWINSIDNNAPFFGLLLPMNSHHPFWTPKDEYKIMPETDKINRYINALRYQDFLVGKLFDFLKRTNRLKNTIVIITGDHGTVFNTLNEKGRNRSLYLVDKATVQVPCYIYIPFKQSMEFETDIIGNHVDIMPTILDLLGIEIDNKIQGRSLFDPKISERISFIYTDYYRHTVTGLTSNYSLMRDMTEDLTILSKSLNFEQNYCDDSKELCELIKAKVDDFDNYQNLRLYSYSK